MSTEPTTATAGETKIDFQVKDSRHNELIAWGNATPAAARKKAAREIPQARMVVEKVTRVRDAEGFWTVQAVEVVQ